MIAEALRGKHLLVTGVTGFLGKVWVGFLLERLPDIGKITLLVRGRRGESAGSRARAMFERSPALRPLRERHGRELHEFLRTRVQVVSGDAREPMLGITSSVAARLLPTVDAVVHVAGLTDFAPDPMEAVAVNTRGAAHAADVAAQTRGRRLVHVSTCFVAGMVSGEVKEELVAGRSPNGTLFEVTEELRSLESACRAIDARVGNPKAIDARRGRVELATQRAQALGWPNVYTYSKGLAEQMLAKRDDIAITMVRPSIVECAHEFPFAGWNEGLNTSAPLVWMCTGYAWKVPIRADNCFDVVPVDSVARGMTIAVADALMDRAAPVYQLASGDHNRFTFGRALDLAALKVRKGYAPSGSSALERLLLTHLDAVASDHGADRSFFVPAAERTTKWLRDTLIKTDTKKYLPKALGEEKRSEIAMRVQRAGMRMNLTHKTVRSIENMWKMYQPFIHDHDYLFRTDAVRDRTHALSPDERAKFGWDMTALDWRHYWMEVEIPGLDKWSLPIIRNEPVPEDDGFDLGGDVPEALATLLASEPSAQSSGTQSPTTQSSGTQSPGTQSPTTQSSGTQSPGTQPQSVARGAQ